MFSSIADVAAWAHLGLLPTAVALGMLLYFLLHNGEMFRRVEGSHDLVVEIPRLSRSIDL